MKLTAEKVSKINDIINMPGKMKVVRVNVSETKGLTVEEHSSNIYCINEDNEIIWQVKDIEKRPFDSDMFVYIKVNDKGEIIGNRFSGFRYKINPETGDAKIDGFDK